MFRGILIFQFFVWLLVVGDFNVTWHLVLLEVTYELMSLLFVYYITCSVNVEYMHV